MSKKIISIMIVFFLITTPLSFAKTNDHPMAELVLDLSEGTVIKNVNADLPLSIASTSKIMTYILVMDAVTRGKLQLDTVVTVMPTAVQRFGSNYKLKKWDKLTVMELLESMLIISANDSALVLSEAVSGSQSRFVDAMNARAKGLHLDTAKFYNPNGLPEKDLSQNTMSANDLAKLYAYALKQYPYPLKKIVSQPYFEGRYKFYKKENSNALVESETSIYGMKTGYTHDAGYCLVGYAKKSNTEYLTILLNGASSEERYDKTTGMLSWVDELSLRPLFVQGEKYGTVTVKGTSYDLFVEKDIIEMSHPDQRNWRANLESYDLEKATHTEHMTVKQQNHSVPLTVKPSLTLEYEAQEISLDTLDVRYQNDQYMMPLRALADKLKWRVAYNNRTKETTLFNRRYQKSYLNFENVMLIQGQLYISLNDIGTLFGNVGHLDEGSNRFTVEIPDNSDSRTD